MPVCRKCKKEFKGKIKIDGKWRNVRNRARCLNCQPFGEPREKEVILKRCKQCKKMFKLKEKEQMFCNHSCSASFTNIGVNRRGGLFVEVRCNNCGALLENRNSIYCDMSCNLEFNFNKKLSRYFMCNVHPVTNNAIKPLIIFALGYECQECGISKWNDKDITLDLEHIDGNSMNNSFMNLTLLCPNCHSQTPTYKSKNVGNGRHSRRKRYKDGKSY